MSIPESEPSPHNLTLTQRERIFQQQIVPTVLSGGVAQQNPAVVYLVSQPGAGKTSSAQIITEALNRRGGSVRFCSDFFKAHHPSYADLLTTHPRDAGRLIRADYKAWKSWGEQYVAERKHDAVIEMAPGSVEQFAASAERFSSQGYHVAVAIIGLPGAQSRLGTGLRYADQIQRTPDGGRWPTAQGHDQCYEAVAAIAANIDQGRLPVDEAMVVRRGLHRVPTENGSVSQTLTAERTRQLSPNAQTQFSAGVMRLHQELPARWQPEIRDIVARAEPILPQRAQARLMMKVSLPETQLATHYPHVGAGAAHTTTAPTEGHAPQRKGPTPGH